MRRRIIFFDWLSSVLVAPKHLPTIFVCVLFLLFNTQCKKESESVTVLIRGGVLKYWVIKAEETIRLMIHTLKTL